jgi:hypothetical protein
MIYLPLEHIEQRYTTHLDRDIVEYLKRKKLDVTYIEPKVLSHEIKHGSFLDADNTIFRQFYQFQKLIELLINGEVKTDETIFVSDIWNFALLAIPYLNFFSNYNLKVRGVLHAGSFTDTDFVRQMERVYKGMEESIFDICDEIYLGSNFIKEDLLKKRYVEERKLVVTGLPLDFEGLNKFKTHEEKEDIIVFNGRNVDEKQPYLFDLLQKKLPQYTYINTQRNNYSKPAYYNVLSKAKCVVSFALQENFGYGIQEAVYLGCIPALPNRLAYVEQFSKDYLYNNFDECVTLVDNIMQNKVKPTSTIVTNNDDIFNIWFKNL